MNYATLRSSIFYSSPDQFRAIMGNGYQFSGNQVRFRETYGSDNIQLSIFQEAGFPKIKFTKLSDEEGAVTHRMEIRYTSGFNFGVEGPQDISDAVRDVLVTTEDVDGMGVEYNPPGQNAGGLFPGGVGFQQPDTALQPQIPTIIPPQNTGMTFEGILGNFPSGGGRLPNTTSIPEFGDAVVIPGEYIPGVDLDQTPNLPGPLATGSVDFVQTQEDVLLQIQDALQAQVGELFLDTSFEAGKPFTEQDLLKLSLNNPAFVGASGHYLFYDEKYENKYSSPDTAEVQAPNLYTVLATATPSNQSLTDVMVQGDYGTMANIAFLEDNEPPSPSLSSKGFLFPLFVQLQQTSETSEAREQMKKAKLHNVFSIDYLRRIIDGYSGFHQLSGYEVETKIVDPENGEPQFQQTVTTQEIRAFKFNDWVGQIINLGDGLETETSRRNLHDITYFDVDGMKVTVIDGFDEIDRSNIWDVFGTAMALMGFQAYLQTFVRNYARSYVQLWTGEMGVAQPLLYTIDKLDSTTGKLVQRFLLWGESDKVLEYIDTQVKYGGRYDYTFRTHFLTNCTQYHYENLMEWNRERAAVVCDVMAYPELFIIEVETQTISTEIKDAIPATPSFNLLPFRDIPNKLLITLGESGGGGEVTFYGFSDEVPPPAPVVPQDDDILVEYETYRISTPPTSWDDFRNGVRRAISTKYTFAPGQSINLPAVSYHDDIEPNTDYYYIFRGKDVHGHVSSFGDIFFYHTVAQGNRHVPIIRTVSPDVFEENRRNYRVKTKDVRRFVMIRPAFLQAALDRQQFEGAESVNEIPHQPGRLGLAAHSPWDRKYRLRVRSKHSGRSIDVIFSFKQDILQ
jgi:hypothetical protein